jgi:hypothetical protein
LSEKAQISLERGVFVENSNLQPLPGFKSTTTHHCVTGSLQQVFAYHEHPLSEEMLLGIGSGLGFIYWHMKGTPPMLGGRGNVWRPGQEGLVLTASRRCGVMAERFQTSSAKKAGRTLIELLEAGQPVMIHVDMGFLPYLEGLPEGYHFGYHLIVVAGIDQASGMTLIADRDSVLHPVSMEDLAQARGSTYKPFPPRNTWYTFDFAGARSPMADEVRTAIDEVCTTMLEGPISNIGVRGIRKTADRVLGWPETMDEEELRFACFNVFVFIDETGGTGGGLFRYMYGRFLKEAASILPAEGLVELGDELIGIGDQWQSLAGLFKHASRSEHPRQILPETTKPLLRIAEGEQSFWKRLQEAVVQ